MGVQFWGTFSIRLVLGEGTCQEPLVEPNQDLHMVVLHPQISDLFPVGVGTLILRRDRNMYIEGARQWERTCGFKAARIVRGTVPDVHGWPGG